MFLIIFSHYNVVFSQTKTPYQKKYDRIMTEMCQAIGVKKLLIQMAINQNDWDIVRTSQDFAFNARMLDKNILLMIVLATDKKLKEAEKLKNNLDFKRDAREKNIELNKKKIEEDKKQNEIKIQADKIKEEEKTTMYENSDYYKIINKVSNKFSEWLTKGEFEKFDEYNSRLENRYVYFLDICNDAVLKQLNDASNFKTEYDEILDENDFQNGFELLDYNADKESFDFKWSFKNLIISSSVYVSLKDAPEFKNVTEYNNIHLSDKRTDYCLIDNYIYCRKILIDNINNKPVIVVPLTLNKTQTRIIITTNDLNLKNYNFEILKFDYEDYKDIKSEILFKNAEKIEATGNFQEALKSYLNILDFNKNSQMARNKINQITDKINELDRAKLISEAEELYKNNYLSKSKQKYIEANEIRSSDGINKLILEIEKTITESNSKHSKLLDNYSLCYSSDKIFFSIKIYNDLVNITKNYGPKYKSCIDIINETLKNKWQKVYNDYNLYKTNSIIEIWTIQNQELFEEFEKWLTEFDVYKIFEDKIFKAVLNEDKKFLKILKEDSEKIIIETIIKTSLESERQEK